jgi:hypothetical protein
MGDVMRLKFVAAGLVAAGAASVLYAATRTPTEELNGEIGTWIAGSPQQCIDLRRVTASRALGDTMLFKVRSAIKYRTTSPGCPSAKVGATLVTNPDSVHLCKGDIVGLVDLENGMQEGSCEVGEFTPYTRK